MELVFPRAIYVGIPVALALLLIGLKRKDKFRKGKKIANTGFIEETKLYKKLMRNYKVFSFLALTCLWLSIVICVVMFARPAEVEIIAPEVNNRDIFICMDISDSVDELNLDICVELKEVVKELNGERFGISIFNGRSVLLVPLTTDYDYVLDTMDHLEEAFKFSLENEGSIMSGSELYHYKYEGTLCDYGSSFIGDGLASCLYSFPDLEEDPNRSRLIIFTTDNELNGTPLVTVEEAAALCKKNDVKVFAVTPTDIVDREVFKNAMNSTGGGFYEASSDAVFDELIEDIRLTKTSVMVDMKTIINDKPEFLFMCLLVCLGMYFLFSRKVKL